MTAFTAQQNADALLQIWQTSRALPPLERMEILMRDFFSPLLPCETEYESMLRDVARAMEMADV